MVLESGPAWAVAVPFGPAVCAWAAAPMSNAKAEIPNVKIRLIGRIWILAPHSERRPMVCALTPAAG